MTFLRHLIVIAFLSTNEYTKCHISILELKPLSSCMLTAYVLILIWVLMISLTIVLWSKGQSSPESISIGCSVIVPFRNEAQNLNRLIEALKTQSHPNFEVIFIDDHSSDGGQDVIQSNLEESILDYRVLSLNKENGKKAALTQGILKAKYPIIFTTDADCSMGMDWLSSMIGHFDHKSVNLVAGPVNLEGSIPIQRFQSLEMSALMGVTAASIKFNSPTMANGANLAFRKSVFEKLEGYKGIDHIPSGDDELFMHKVQKNFPGSIRFDKDVRALVTTDAKRTIVGMVSQKRRWASKWKINKRWSTVMLALFVFAVNLSQLTLIYETLTLSESFQLSLWAILLKCLAEILLIAQVRSDLKVKSRYFDYLIAFIFYPIYAIYIGVAANFGSYQWKGRRYS